MQPGMTLTLKGSKFASRSFTSTEERRHPIDLFFNSLAEEFQTNAIGIVMSGTGTDGANGLRTLREKGGRALVQLPAEAKILWNA